MIRITENFTLDELVASSTAAREGIENTPDTNAVISLSVLTAMILQPLRDWYKGPIKIGSGYRSPVLNRKVGGVSNSQHVKGQAVDLCIDGDLNKGRKWFNYIRDNLEFDQLIWEHSRNGSYWVHVSYNNSGRNRRQVINNLLKR